MNTDKQRRYVMKRLIILFIFILVGFLVQPDVFAGAGRPVPCFPWTCE